MPTSEALGEFMRPYANSHVQIPDPRTRESEWQEVRGLQPGIRIHKKKFLGDSGMPYSGRAMETAWWLSWSQHTRFEALFPHSATVGP